MILYRVDPREHYCPCKAYAYSKANPKTCKHLQAVMDRGMDKWNVFRLEPGRWIAARKEVGFVADTITDLRGIVK